MSSALVDGQLRRGRRRFAAYVVHAAAVICIIAIAVSTSMRQTHELHFAAGQTQKVSGFDVTFLGVEDRSEPHRVSTIARFGIARDGRQVAILEPRMNQYQQMREPIGSPDVYTTAAGDFYIALTSLDTRGDTASISVFASPLVVWIWISVIAMGLGALFGLVPVGRRREVTVADEAIVGSPETA